MEDIFLKFVRELAERYKEEVPELLTSEDLDSNVDDAVSHGYEVGYAQAVFDLAKAAKEIL